MKPTTDQFAAYQQAFDYFNAKLFGNELPPCILNFSRHANSYGFFVPDTWRRDGAAIGLPWCTIPRLDCPRAKAKKTPYVCAGGCETKVWTNPAGRCCIARIATNPLKRCNREDGNREMRRL